MAETQDALDHASLGATRAYAQRIAIKKDRFSQRIRDRLRRIDQGS
jgi:hypothetical protein